MPWKLGLPFPSGRRVTLGLLTLFLSLLSAVAAAAPLTTRFAEADLQTLLRNNPSTGRPVDSIEELMPLLPRGLRSNFTFVYDSRSPFRASISPHHPRLILFTEDGRFVMTFTGDPDKPGADLLETMSFDDASARFDLNVHRLPAAIRRGFSLSPGAANCTSCHGADPRPIYDSYPLWPGFYGSVLDTFPHDKLGVAELEKYLAFLATTAKTGVYKELIFARGSRATPYLDPRKFRSDSVELNDKSFPFLPNARLGMALTELNRKRVYRKLTEGATFQANEKRILAELLECRPEDRPRRVALRAIKAWVERENVARVKRLGAASDGRIHGLHDMQELDFVRELAAIDKAAALAGVGRSDWSMALEHGSLAFFDGILSGLYAGKSYYLKEDLIYEILAHLAAREPVFRRYFRSDAVFADLGYPFGNRVDMGPALASCGLLANSAGHVSPHQSDTRLWWRP